MQDNYLSKTKKVQLWNILQAKIDKTS